MANSAIVSSVAKKMGNTSTMSSNRAYSNRKSRKDKYGDSTSKSVGRVCTLVGPTCYGGKLGK